MRSNHRFRFNNCIFDFSGKTNFYVIVDYRTGANKRIITYQAVCANHYRTLNNGTMTNTGIRADNNFTCSFINNYLVCNLNIFLFNIKLQKVFQFL